MYPTPPKSLRTNSNISKSHVFECGAGAAVSNGKHPVVKRVSIEPSVHAARVVDDEGSIEASMATTTGWDFTADISRALLKDCTCSYPSMALWKAGDLSAAQASCLAV